MRQPFTIPSHRERVNVDLCRAAEGSERDLIVKRMRVDETLLGDVDVVTELGLEVRDGFWIGETKGPNLQGSLARNTRLYVLVQIEDTLARRVVDIVGKLVLER